MDRLFQGKRGQECTSTGYWGVKCDCPVELASWPIRPTIVDGDGVTIVTIDCIQYSYSQ